MASVSASVNLPLHHKVQKFSSGTSSPGWSWKKGRKTVVVWLKLSLKLIGTYDNEFADDMCNFTFHSFVNMSNTLSE